MSAVGEDQIIVFGGTNLESYCVSTLHTLNFNGQHLGKFLKKFESAQKSLKIKSRQVLKEKSIL